ncbi:MAG TPA: ATP-binding protein [Desulfotignum sp.]|nr:ATP-binding protein [Desulfotignum sp.]
MSDCAEFHDMAQLKAIFDGIPHIAALVNDQVGIDMINEKGAVFTGRKCNTISGQLCGDVFHCVNALDNQVCGLQPDCRLCPLRTKIITTFQTGTCSREEEGQITFLRSGSRATRDFLISTTLINVNKTPKVFLNMEDITENKLLKTRLHHAQKMEAIGSLTGGIAHDFNNILFPVVGITEMLLDDLPSDSPEYESVQQIHHAGKKGTELVKQILSFSRQHEAKSVPVLLQKVVKEIIHMCRSTIPSHITVNLDMAMAGKPVLADPVQLHQVAMNLITNAWQSLYSTGGTIDIKITEITIPDNALPDSGLPSGTYNMLTVTDDGPGIPEEIMPRIFDMFFTTKKPDKGTGLGLAVVADIVHGYGGEITVTSIPGGKTTFTVYLPVMKTLTAHKLSRRPKNMPTGTETILLVDDEASIVNIERKMLERLGYEVTEQTSSPAALALFKADPGAFDLVITDLSMPDMDGDVLARKILSVRSDMPVIICTGFSEKTDALTAQGSGIKGVLLKPVVLMEMAQIVRGALDNAKKIQ